MLMKYGHLRQAWVNIENKDYKDLIACFGRPGTFFYLDLPYFGYESYYGDGSSQGRTWES